MQEQNQSAVHGRNGVCHEKDFYVPKHICPNMSAGAVTGYVGITVSDRLVNRKEVRSICGVLISTSVFSSLLLETSRDKNVIVTSGKWNSADIMDRS